MNKTIIRHTTLSFLCILSMMGCRDTDRYAYEMQQRWPGLPEDYFSGVPSGLAMNALGNLVVLHRSGNKNEQGYLDAHSMLTIDAESGKILKEWGAGFFINPHGVTTDAENNIWVTDTELHQVFKFSPDGTLMLTLGSPGLPGDDSTHFNKPTDVAVASDGSFYVSDGYVNSRVCKFSADGTYLFEWGTKGSAPGQFDLPHGLATDTEGNVYVADRENGRIQKFTATGEFINEWAPEEGGEVYGVAFDVHTNHLYAIDYLTIQDSIAGSDISIMDTSLNRQAYFGRSGGYSGPVCRYHDIEVDKTGNVYTADLLNHNIYKFTPSP